MIADLKQQRSTFTKRRKTLFKKASEMSERTGARANVIVRSSTGTTYYGSYPSGKEIISKKTRRKGKVISPMGLIEWEEDWVEQEYDFCRTKEDYESLFARCVACAVRVRKRLEDWESKPSAEAGDPGVEVDCDSEILPHKNLNPVLESFDASIGLLLTFGKDTVGHGDCNSPVISAGAGPSNPTSSGLDDYEYSVDELFDLAESGVPNVDLPGNSAIGGPSNPTRSGLGDFEFSMDDDLFRPENSAISRTADPTSSGLDDGEFNPDAFLNLSEDYIGDGDRPENSAFGGGYNPDDFAGLGDLDIPPDIGYF
ncbi:hypothetical protein ACJRO7_009807 [Eucalyptus globulus]|uniref:MADS-box domain-containing protein n=1 Tax=Eucalyptus globulus TaxID=34317 RepID=A0ABD3LEU7_EUCGL